ncbi:MAG: amidase [Myxococcota bacterium]
MSSYQRDPVNAPRLRGTPLKLFVETLESPLGRAVLGKITHDSGLGRFRDTPANGNPLQEPLPHPASLPSKASSAVELANASLSTTAKLPFETAAQFAVSYRSGAVSPVEVARRVVEAIGRRGKGEGSLNLFIASHPEDLLAQAEASAERFRRKRPLSLLDGVPVAVKDEMDQAGYPTTVGTSFLGTEVAREDATAVARLRAAGAVLIGKTNMHEVGINTIGINPHHGAARNPYDRSHITGGSSSGSAASVAAGLCPIAVGADGGGSIRIPSALCGVVGLKATFGRISEHGVFPLCWTVGHVGPIGASVRDVAAAYALMAGVDPLDAITHAQPPVHLDGLERLDLSGVRLGVCKAYFEDAERSVVERCEELVKAFVRAGAGVVEVPPPDFNTILWSHLILILSEMASSLAPHLREDTRRFGYDVRTNLAIGRFLEATDYVHALRHRRMLTAHWLEVMKGVDVFVTPTTATTAPAMPERALPEGESNLRTTDELMRFIRIGNLTGFPALSVPAGYDAQGLPVGCQLMGRPWEEHLLLRLGLVAESAVERCLPAHHVRLLER